MKKTANSVVICGAGKMGVAIGYAMKTLGYELAIVETNPHSIESFCRHVDDCQVYGHWSQIDHTPAVLISALPYHATLDAALWAIDNEIRYCDLGGSVPTSAAIKALAERKAVKPVMTDLGLAPGWVNLIAEEMYYPGVETIGMMVGGIPMMPRDDDPIQYMATWSIDGLLNEYMDDCEILENGEKIILPGMAGLDEVHIDGLELEAFYTSGASAHSIPVMAERGVRNIWYKTLRWRGHCDVMSWLMRAVDFDRKTLERILEFSSRQHHRDVVIIHVVASHGDVRTSKTIRVVPTDQFSAMQRATAFPIASVADIMISGVLDEIKYPTYADVPLGSFNGNLTKLLA